MALHSYLLRFGLTKPTVGDILEKIIKNKISKQKLKMLQDEDFYVKSSILIKNGIDELEPCLIHNHGKFELRLRSNKSYFIPVNCQFVAERLDEINNSLSDIESKIESEYIRRRNIRLKQIAEREQKILQETKCMTKLWELYR